MTTYDFTAAGLRAPSRSLPLPVSNAAILPSSLTQASQIIARPGEHWRLDLTWDNASGAELDDLIAFFTRLNGPEHRVNLKMYGQSNRGAFGGTPLVAGASQTGNTLVADGASSTVTGWAKARDYISFDNQIRMVTADVNSDGGGNLSLPIWPAIRTSPANNDHITTSDPTGIFILASPLEAAIDSMRRTASGENISTLTLSFVEDVTA